VLQVPVLAEKELALLCLVVAHLGDLAQLGGEGLLQLGEHGVVVLQLLDAVQQLGVLDDHLLPRVVVVRECEVGLLSPAHHVKPLLLEKAVLLLQSCSLVCHEIHGGADLLDLQTLGVLLLFNLASHLVQLVHLLCHLRGGVLVFLLQARHRALVLDMGLLQVSPQLSNFSLTFLVQFNLR